MCGIVAYTGHRPAAPVLLEGLQRLEYRGYDSAGAAVLPVGQKPGTPITTVKNVGKVRLLAEKCRREIPELMLQSGSGIAHTRWATHGLPTEANAHPHLSDAGDFAVVHNGIIENYLELRSYLTRRGHTLRSETDSEVLAHLIAESYAGDLLQAVAAALSKVTGTYGIAVLSSRDPECIVTARKGSPIVIGVGSEENLVASDVAALAACTRRVIYLNDGDIALLTPDSISIRTMDNVPVTREVANIDWDVSAAEKGEYAHFMLKEIFEQPDALRNTLRGRLDRELKSAKFNNWLLAPREMANINRVVIAGCGTSMHAGMVGEYFFEDIAGIPAEVAQAAEFRYRNPILESNTLVIPISQSGETADTLAAVREAKVKGAIIAAICNVVGSTIAREAEQVIYLHAGPEIGVASTKAFTCQVTVLLLMSLFFGRSRRLDRNLGNELIAEIERIPDLVQSALDQLETIRRIAERYAKYDNFFYIGRGLLYPTALEGALKLKEISYIHAEGYHAAELKHGPIALLEERVPVVALANDIPGKDKLLGNIQECRARKSPVIAIATEGDTEIAKFTDDVIYLPKCSRFIAPVPTAVVLQLLAYRIACERGCEVDQPRNLAKSVTVE